MSISYVGLKCRGYVRMMYEPQAVNHYIYIYKSLVIPSIHSIQCINSCFVLVSEGKGSGVELDK